MWMLVMVVGAAGLAIGFLVGRIGRWVQLSQIESRLRALKLDARVAQDMGEPLPPEWVADQIEWVLGNELRV
jgi:hypothetical protein